MMTQATKRPGTAFCKRLEQPIADHPLRLGAEDVERVGGEQARVTGALQRQQPHLGPVAMSDHQLVVARASGRAPPRRRDVVLLDVGVGALPTLEQRVPPERRDDPHRQSSSVATMTALIVWSRFSAWSNTIERGLEDFVGHLEGLEPVLLGELLRRSRSPGCAAPADSA